MKKLYFICILLCLLTWKTAGCSSEREVPKTESLPPFSQADALDLMERTLVQGGTEFQIKCAYEDGLENRIPEELNAHFQERCLMRCLAGAVTVECTRDQDTLTADCKISYTETADGCGPVYTVRNETELEQVLSDSYLAHAQKTAVLLDQFTLTEQEFFDHMDNAEINCSLLACEATGLTYAMYEPDNGQTLFLAWATFPTDAQTLQPGQDALFQAVEEAALNISPDKEPAGQYKEIYDYLIERARYDDNIFQATLLGEHYVTTKMHMQRSAYGALVDGNTVCSGYARAYKAICDRAGLPCYTLLGSHNGIYHAWNAVYVDGETKYIDCTLADTGGTEEQTFLFSEEQKNAWGYTEEAFCQIPW